MRHPEFLGDRLSRRIEIDAHDHRRARHPRALHDVQADTAEAEDDDAIAGLYPCSVEDSTDSGGDAASDVTNFFERRVSANFREGYFRYHRIVRESRGAHIVMKHRSVARESARAVGHDAAALRLANGSAKIGLARKARWA